MYTVTLIVTLLLFPTPANYIAQEDKAAVIRHTARVTQQEERAEYAHQKWHEEQERKAAQAPAMSNQGMWEAIAQCESGGNWSINTGNSFYGGLQFNKLSWDWAGGQKYAAYPHQATKAQQIAVANELLRIHPAGLGAWPACTKKLGLR